MLFYFDFDFKTVTDKRTPRRIKLIIWLLTESHNFVNFKFHQLAPRAQCVFKRSLNPANAGANISTLKSQRSTVCTTGPFQTSCLLAMCLKMDISVIKYLH